jgi:hypothetical protein
MSGKTYRLSAQVLLASLFAVCVYRAFTQSITFDEAATWDTYIRAPVDSIFHVYIANHHFLNTLLARLSTALFGVSEWSMRLPALAGAALYFTACYRLARTAFGDGFSMLLAVALAALNPLVLDFMVAARGYGLALALWMWAAAVLLDAFSRQTYPRTQMLIAGSALALSVTANLVFVLPAAALAGMAVYLIRRPSASLPVAAPDAPKKSPTAPSRARHAGKKQKSAPPPQARKLGLAPWIWFALPILGIAFVFLNLAPFDKMTSANFYTGALTIRESLRSLASSSLEHSGPLRRQPWVRHWTDVVAFGIAPLVVVAGLIIGLLRRNLMLLLAASAAVFSGVALLLIHVLLDKPYPSDRTGIYFLPLVTFLLVGLAHFWRDHQGPGRAAAIAAYIVGVALVVHFATEFNTRKFLVWEYDADTRSIGDYVAAHRPQNQEIVRVGGSWQLQQSLRFYAAVRNWTWIELRTEEPAAGLDYYALVPPDRVPVELKLRLHEVYVGPVSGSALAKPQ